MTFKDKISIAFTGLMVLCALIITVLVIRQQFFSTSNINQQAQPIDLELGYIESGTKEAPVRIVEFFDYQCPFCKSVQPTLRSIQKKYPEKVSVIYAHFPLSDHKYAFDAAVAAECARKQKKFESYHKLLFENQKQLGEISYRRLAKEVGVTDSTSFSICVENLITGEAVVSGLNLAERLNISSIPSFLINDKIVTGVLSEQQFIKIIETELDSK
ncbi:MAG TPA: thioredoxin domain-containing protein [Bacteroidales bacterium]|nr:thioredoxin domain-containing protein [Bacteroidales bacterium]